MTLALIVFAPLFGAFLPFLVGRVGTRLPAAWAAALVTFIPVGLILPLVGDVFDGGVLIYSWEWLPAMKVSSAFRLDGLALLFVLLILGVGLLVILYARYYLPEDRPLGRFFMLLLVFMGSMLGVVLSENLLMMLVFWEMTSASSFFLIAYDSDRPAARQAARMSLIVTGGGGVALLAGIILLGETVGSYDLSVILTSGDEIKSDPLYLPMLILILLGVFTKSAQFPFHFWLPSAMAAPTPVSAYLHSATMVKAGVFLLARLFPALSGTEIWFYLVSGTGMLTLLMAAYGALFQHDFKGLLAYSTISHLGLITLLFGLGTPLGAVAGVFHIMNHAIFKASLFMAAGIIDHECGTRDMRRINGLFKYMPYTAVLAIIAAAAMAGVPLMNGFLSKEMFFAEALHQAWLGDRSWLLPTGATLAGVFAVAYSLRFIHDVFFNGEPVDLPRTPHEPPRWMKVPVEILVALCVLVGVFPELTISILLQVSAGSLLLGQLPTYSLAIWHGFTPAFLMSLIALGGGVAVYAQRRRLFEFHARYFSGHGAKDLFDAFIAAILAFARGTTRWLDNGSLQRYLALLLFSVVLLVGLGWWLGPQAPLTGSRVTTPVDGVTLFGAFALAVGALGTVALHRQRLLALVPLSVVGLMVSLAFVRFSAPDLALTQLSVEVVTIVLILLILYFLPQRTPVESGGFRHLRDALIALVSGAGAAALSWAMLTRPLDSISGYFLEQALPGGGGTNVVNVILVDFRGFDTLGEIAVLAVAALGVHAMLEGIRLRQPSAGSNGQQWSPDVHPLFLQVVTRLLLPLAVLVSIYILLRGHNLPGGGFIAGLVTGVALILQYLGSGIVWTRTRLNVSYYVLFAGGLATATLTGLGSWFFDRPFLTTTFGHVHWPIVGDFELASALLFDLGVYLTVVGAVLLILAELGKLAAPQADPHAVPAGGEDD